MTYLQQVSTVLAAILGLFGSGQLLLFMVGRLLTQSMA